MTGHLLGAQQVLLKLWFVKYWLLKTTSFLPTINHQEDDKDPELDYKFNFTFNKAQKREVRASLSNTFGFGGPNARVVFKKYAD